MNSCPGNWVLSASVRTPRYPEKFALLAHSNGRNLYLKSNSQGKTVCPPLTVRWLALHCASEGFWHALFETNVVAMMALSQLVGREMVARRSGQIVIVTSVLARQVYPMTVGYAATKHALSAFAQGLRLELKDFGVRVMEFAPGFTGGTEFLRNTVDEAVLKSAFTRPYAPKTPEDCAQALMGALTVGGNAEIDLLQMRALGQV